MRHICDTTNYVCECNRAFDKETRHPQVSLIDMSGKSSCRNMATDCYAVKVVSDGCTAGKCGQHYYDFSEATMTFCHARKRDRPQTVRRKDADISSRHNKMHAAGHEDKGLLVL